MINSTQYNPSFSGKVIYKGVPKEIVDTLETLRLKDKLPEKATCIIKRESESLTAILKIKKGWFSSEQLGKTEVHGIDPQKYGDIYAKIYNDMRAFVELFKGRAA